MYLVIKDALLDSLVMVPFLLLIYFFIEWLEFRYGGVIQRRIQQAGKAGPLAGALFGCIPQCGFSVIGSALYARRMITLGTLLAVYLSTSDEAVPVILAQPQRIGLVLPMILTKVIIALVAGFGIDLLFRDSRRHVAVSHATVEPVVVGGTEQPLQSAAAHAHDEAEEGHTHDEPVEVEACCGHHVDDTSPRRELWLHPVRHTTQVFVFVFLVSLGINYLDYAVGGSKNLSGYLLSNSAWQPVLTALVGLIPNCAASVAITQLYLGHAISYGSAIAGLCSSAGLGMLILLKENHDLRDTLRVLLLLLSVSIAAGIVIQMLEPIWHLSPLR
ncbi:MAG TPA: putative manganese transporter [Armatimonadota bacterium]|jgi:hypothetical protein